MYTVTLLKYLQCGILFYWSWYSEHIDSIIIHYESVHVTCWTLRCVHWLSAESSLNMFPETRTLFLKTLSFQMKRCTQKREADVSTQHTQLWYEHHHVNVIKILFMNLLASWGHVTCSNVFIKYCNLFGELCSISGCDFMGYTEQYSYIINIFWAHLS